MARKSRKQEMQTAAPVQILSPKEMIYSCGVYGRLSLVNSGKPDHGDSLENQISICTAYVEGHIDLQLADTYTDNGQKGTTFERPEFNRLMEDVRSGKINCIIVKDLSRFGRDYLEAGEYLEKIFPFMGVRFIAVTDGYDSLHSSADENMMTVPLKNMINELYAKDLSQKICTSIHARMEKGEFLPGRLCYGYLRSEEDKLKMVPDPVTAPYVKLMFELRLSGASYEEIRRRLDEIHAITPNERKSQIENKLSAGRIAKGWYSTSVRDCLHNPVYLGHTVYGKQPKALYKGVKKAKNTPSEEWQIVENTHEPLIEQSVFDRVQEINRKTKAAYYKNHPPKETYDNIYRGILFCGDCGKYMEHGSYTCKGTGKVSVFRCGGYRGSNRRDCTIHTIKESNLHDAVLAAIRQQIQVFADMGKAAGRMKRSEACGKMQREFEAQAAELLRKKSRLATLRESLYESFQDGLLDEQEYIGMKEDYLGQEAAVRQRLDELENRKKLIAGYFEQVEGAADRFQQFAKKERLDRKMLETFVQKIKVYEGGRLEIIFRYDDVCDSYQELERGMTGYEE